MLHLNEQSGMYIGDVSLVKDHMKILDSLKSSSVSDPKTTLYNFNNLYNVLSVTDCNYTA